MTQKLNHIAIIPDGNRRWARARNMPSFEGHRIAAEKTLPAIIDHLQAGGIKYFTFWVMSTENLKNRTKDEVNHLMRLMRMFIKKSSKELHKKNIRIKTIGDLTKLPEDLQKQLTGLKEQTAENTDMTIILAINYGGKDELLRAIKRISTPETVSAENFSMLLDTGEFPDPDLIIRTGGDKRTSGFMLWQSEYAEYTFVDNYFPDFKPEDVEVCIQDFTHRQRRFGK
jgi:undecaprenyl diphosphate synthase